MASVGPFPVARWLRELVDSTSGSGWRASSTVVASLAGALGLGKLLKNGKEGFWGFARATIGALGGVALGFGVSWAAWSLNDRARQQQPPASSLSAAIDRFAEGLSAQ